MWLAASAILALGVLCLVAGVRGRRVDDHPVCRQCGFDLVGLVERAKCPECGADASGTKGVRIGRRKRRRWLIAAGMVLALLGCAGMGALGWGAATKFDWNRVKPDLLLLLEVRGRNADEGVVKELARRFRGGELSAEESARLIDRALAVQADTGAAWSRWWAEIVESGRTNGAVSDEQWKRYALGATGSLKLEAKSSRFVRRQGQLYFAPSFAVGEGRGGLSLTLQRHFHIDALIFDGKEVEIPADWFGNRESWGGQQLGVSGGFSRGLMPVPDADGVVKVEIVVTESVEDQAAAGERVIAKRPQRLTGEFNVSGAKEDGYPPPGLGGWQRGPGNPANWRPMQSGPAVTRPSGK